MKLKSFLRDMILRGKLKPGERIVESRVARQLRVGQATIREALEALQDEGLVIRHPNRGCTVVELSHLEVRQIFRLRLEWEPLAVDLAMENWADAKSEQLAAAVRELETAAEKKDPEVFYRRDLEFHRTLWLTAENPFLAKALSQITVPLFAFVMIEVTAHPEFDLAANAAEHRRVAEAIFSGNRLQAIYVTRQAILSFQEAWRQSLAIYGSEEDQ